MYKSNTELIVIDAKATEPIPTKVVFWSHDKGTAKMLFQLQKDYVNQTLSEGTIVPICLDFVGGRHIYHAVIEDAVNGIVSIVLEDNILGYQGRVDGSIYIELPDSRSLDTAGRFTFHIKRSPIDEDVPELENYYWQGFSDIMEQYHESITEIKLEAKTLLDSLTADVTTAQNKVSTLEQSITTANTNLNSRIDEINKKIDDNDVFTKAESSANVILQAIGKEKVQLTLTLDFKDKITGSIIENLNTMKSGGGSSLYTPSAPYTEILQNSYQSVSMLDNSLDTISSSSNLSMAHALSQFNVLGAVKRLLGEEFFISQGAISLSQQLEIVRDILTEINPMYWGYGSSPAGNSLYYKIWVNSRSWSGDVSSSSSNVAKLEYKSSGNSDQNYISNDGFLYAMAHSGASNGTTASLVKTDYTCLNLTIELSMNQFIKSMIAQNHVENLATQTEATNATDNAKTMTPLRTKQLLDSKLLNMVYPIGSIYMSVNSATPATLFGGTWERFSKGRVLVGVDESDTVLATSGKQGGSTNPLTAHTHVTQLTTYRVTSGTGSGSANNLGRATDVGDKMTGEFGSVTSTGDNTYHNNWQPFTTVYMWKRTA